MTRYIDLRSTPPKTSIPYGDTDEMRCTLNELKAWLDDMIITHGGDAKFSLNAEGEDGEDARVHYEIERVATLEEIESETRRKAVEDEKYKAHRRAEFESLKKEFEG